MCFIGYDSEDSAAAAVYCLHGHFLGEMDLEVEVCQYDIRRAQVNSRNAPRFGSHVPVAVWGA
eukprot:2111883-Alexandrium_andersonii.AAC.1